MYDNNWSKMSTLLTPCFKCMNELRCIDHSLQRLSYWVDGPLSRKRMGDTVHDFYPTSSQIEGKK